ncbi:hypothetical protein KP509_27G019700 [Ceratopteris richardii]|uniref:Uncharacterized protein n=1 Tax=Ceratopteris richardii TaxID=49495 RepID=A0A8T2RGW0_CERRI|nr:hypothetical protein KP509_27G019700 [Ceratopteris richardii]
MCERLPLRCLCACQQEVARAVNHQNIAVPRLFFLRTICEVVDVFSRFMISRSIFLNPSFPQKPMGMLLNFHRQRMAWRFVLAGGVLDWFLKIFFHFNRCSLT